MGFLSFLLDTQIQAVLVEMFEGRTDDLDNKLGAAAISPDGMQGQTVVESLLQMRTDGLDNTPAAVGISSHDSNDDDDKSEGLLLLGFCFALKAIKLN